MPTEQNFEVDMLDRLLGLGHPSAFPKGMMMAAAALQGRDWQAAEALMQRLCAAAIPDDQRTALALLASDLGVAKFDGGDAHAANAWLQRAADLAPRQARVQANLAALQIKLGRFDMARASLMQALDIDAQETAALALLGNLAHAEGRLAEAREALEQLVKAAPDDRSARIDLAEVLKDQGLFEAALSTLSNPNGDADMLAAKGNILKSMGDNDGAARTYDESMAALPNPAVRAKRAMMLPVIASDDSEIALSRRTLRAAFEQMIADNVRIHDPERSVGATLFHLAYQGGNDRELMELAARFWRQASPSLSFTAAHINARRTGKRLRIGFVSRHLHAHTMAKLNRGIIADLDRRRFEVFVFQLGRQDDTAREIAGTADHAVALSGPFEVVRQTIADAELDIIYYPDIGMEPTTYFLAFARLAPVQIVACGHPDTTGVDTLDAFISGDPLDLPDAQAHYTEPLLRLGGFPFYMRKPPVGEVKADRDLLNLPKDKNLYACPQSLFKFHPEFDAMLADILSRDPNGKLVLIEQLHPLITQRLKRRLRLSIPDLDERLIVLGRLQPREFMTLLASSSVLLDPWRFGGGSSSLEAFALGLPIVTRPGDFLRERVTMAAYAKMDIMGLCANDAEGYVSLALRIANDTGWKSEISRSIGQNAAALFLDRAELKRMEDAFVKLVETSEH